MGLPLAGADERAVPRPVESVAVSEKVTVRVSGARGGEESVRLTM